MPYEEFVKSGKLTAEQSADILSESEVERCVDLGHSFMYKLIHPVLGLLLLVNSSLGDSGFMTL
jgi:hypothetical protein